MASNQSTAALVISIIALILIIILFLFALIFINSILTHGVPVTISFGGDRNIRENFDTSKFSMFINRTPGSLVKILASNSNVGGKILRIKNNTDSSMTIDTSSLRSFNGGNIPNPKNILGRMLATFVFTGRNELLRTS